MRTIYRMKLVYFPMNIAPGSTTPFPFVPELQQDGVKVVGCFAYDNDTGLQDTPDGIQVMNVSNLCVTLCEGLTERHKDIPYRDLVRERNGGIWYEFEPFAIDLNRSFIQATQYNAIHATVVFVFVYISAND